MVQDRGEEKKPKIKKTRKKIMEKNQTQKKKKNQVKSVKT
jgi:hypothetical protein